MLYPAFFLPIFRRKNEKANTRFTDQVPLSSISDFETNPLKKSETEEMPYGREKKSTKL
jgi:hypothetical protein